MSRAFVVPALAGRTVQKDEHVSPIARATALRRDYKPTLFWLILLFFQVSAISPAWAVERFPPPEFESDYKMPATTAPPSRAWSLEYLDVGVMLLALSAAAYFVLWKRSRKAVFGLMLFSVAYFGFYRQGCVCAIGSIQNIALALGGTGYSAPLAVVAFFLLPLVFALFFGRVFCAAVCPHGALQDFVLVRPIKLWPWLEQSLRLIPFIYLGLAVLLAATGSLFILCKYDPFIALFRLSGSFSMLLLGVGFLLVGSFLGRPYCRFLCPYGALLSLVSRFSKWNVTLTPNDCLQCQICEEACPYGAISTPAEPEPVSFKRPSGMRLAGFIVLLPLLIGLGGWLGSQLATPLSKIHNTVHLAEQIMAEDAGKISVPTDASKAYRQTGQPVSELVDKALAIRRQFVFGGWILGAFVGLVLGGKFIALAWPEKRRVYDPDPAACVACGRCYNYCPKELVRLKRIEPKTACPLAIAQK